MLLRASRIILGLKMCFCFLSPVWDFWLVYLYCYLIFIQQAPFIFFQFLRVNFHQMDVVFSMNNAPVSVMMGKHPLVVMYSLSTLVLFLS